MQLVVSSDATGTVCWCNCYCLLILLVLSADTMVLSADATGSAFWCNWYCLLIQLLLSADTTATVCWYKWYCLLIQLVLYADRSGTACWYYWYHLLILLVLSSDATGTVVWYNEYCLLIQLVTCTDGAVAAQIEFAMRSTCRKYPERLTCAIGLPPAKNAFLVLEQKTGPLVSFSRLWTVDHSGSLCSQSCARYFACDCFLNAPPGAALSNAYTRSHCVTPHTSNGAKYPS